MVDVITRPSELDIWEGALQGEPGDWHRLFDGYEGVDWPAALAWRDIVAAYRDAKVMLSGRDPNVGTKVSMEHSSRYEC